MMGGQGDGGRPEKVVVQIDRREEGWTRKKGGGGYYAAMYRVERHERAKGEVRVGRGLAWERSLPVVVTTRGGSREVQRRPLTKEKTSWPLTTAMYK